MGCMKMASVEQLRFENVSLCPRSPRELKQLSTIKSLRSLVFDRCLMLSSSIDNEFVKVISADREHDLMLFLTHSIPCDRATFAVDDNEILQFLCSGEGKYARRLDICNASVTEELPKHLETVSERANITERGSARASRVRDPLPSTQSLHPSA
jgi:hypothetical protein